MRKENSSVYSKRRIKSCKKREKIMKEKISKLASKSRKREEYFRKRSSDLTRGRKKLIDKKSLEEKFRQEKAKIRKIEHEIFRRQKREKDHERSQYKAKEAIKTKNLLDEMKKVLYKANVQEYKVKHDRSKQLRQIFDEIQAEKAKTEICKIFVK